MKNYKIPKKYRELNPENPGNRDLHLKTPKKSRVKNPENLNILGIAIYFFGISPGIFPGFFSGMNDNFQLVTVEKRGLR